MNDIKWLLREQGRLTEDLEGIKKRFSEFMNLGSVGELLEEKALDSTEMENYQKRINDVCEDIGDAVNRLLGTETRTETKDGKDKMHYAFETLTSITVLDSLVMSLTLQMQLLSGIRGRIGQAASNAFNWLSNYIKPSVQRILNSLWQLISRLMTPKSWTIQGEAGVGFFGLKGNVGISVTF